MTADDGTEHRVTAGAAHAGVRIDRLIAECVAELSRTQARALIEAGRVSAGAATITEPSYRVKPGEVFRVRVPPPTPAKPKPEPIPLEVLYEDSHLLVLDKPAGLVVHPAPGAETGTLVNALLAHCGESLSGIGGVRRPGIVHRLDKDTSGLMVVAKNDAAHRDLAAQFAARTVTRLYRAIVWGAPSPPEGTITGDIGRSSRDRKKMAVVPKGKRAVTRYRVVRRLGAWASLIECRLETGRTHQIRVHLAKKGHPVVGDATYGGGVQAARRHGAPEAAVAEVAALGRHALDAAVLGFTHPATGERLNFAKELPPFMSRLARSLEPM
jgi:23S rRNA pseudouridine1911/1915/1917 synthase